MGEKTNIAWCDHTFNPWIGCQKVSAGCDNCYAETLMDKRYHKVQWGPHGERKRTSEANWKLPFRWAKAARKTGTRPKVFCSSLADVMDKKAPEGARADLWSVIEDTPELDWLLLTKRPENILKFIPPKWDCGLPVHVWVGTTAEDQSAYDRRWPILHQVPARVRFISYEPALGPLDIRGRGFAPSDVVPDWLICGGETGPGYREMPEQWVDAVRYDCSILGIPFFLKQMAGKKPIPYRLMVREFPVPRR